MIEQDNAPLLTDADDRYYVHRIAHWIDRGMDLPAARDMAQSELDRQRKLH